MRSQSIAEWSGVEGESIDVSEYTVGEADEEECRERIGMFTCSLVWFTRDRVLRCSFVCTRVD